MSTQPTPLYREFASILQAIKNCRQRGNDGPLSNHANNIQSLMEYLPSGSGIDNGVKLDLDDSQAERLVFHFSYHNMNEDGYYEGWDDYTMIVTPSLQFGFNLEFRGDGVKEENDDLIDHFHEMFNHTFNSYVWQNPNGEWNCSLYEAVPIQ